MSYLTKEYTEYLKSDTWRDKRQAALRRAGYKCQSCWVSEKQIGVLHVHHRNYDRLGKEKPMDLLVLCPNCHGTEDARRRRLKAIETFAIKKYGSNFRLMDWDFLEAEFNAWVKTKSG